MTTSYHSASSTVKHSGFFRLHGDLAIHVPSFNGFRRFILLPNENYATFLIRIISSFFLKERDLNFLLSLILC